MTTGQRIQQARKKAGLSQKQLGEKLGLSASMIGQWENDLRKPKIETLNRIAAAIGIEAIELVPDENLDEYLIGYMQYTRDCKEKGMPFVPEWAGPQATPAQNRRARILAFYDHVLSPTGQEKAAEAVEIIAGNPEYQRIPASPPPAAPPEGTDTTPPPTMPETPSEGE